MTGKVDRRRFLQYSGYGLVAASGAGLLNGCGDSYNTAENPEFWKVGNYPPVTEEVSETALKVEGSIPPELNGLYVRNGPNAWQGRQLNCIRSPVSYSNHPSSRRTRVTFPLSITVANCCRWERPVGAMKSIRPICRLWACRTITINYKRR